MINKSIKETININYGKSYILVKNRNNESWVTGGEAIKILLEKINLEQACDNFLIKIKINKINNKILSRFHIRKIGQTKNLFNLQKGQAKERYFYLRLKHIILRRYRIY